MIILREYINHFIEFNDEMWEQLSARLKPVTFAKGSFIEGTDGISDAIYFIIDGIVRSYKLEEDGRDFTWTFHCLNMQTLNRRMLMDVAVVDYVSFTQNVPAELSFEVLVDATLMKVSKQDLYNLYEAHPNWQKFATKMAEDSYAVMRERTFNLLTKNAKERLVLLEQYFPGVFEKNVLKEHIASYLGITRQQLNRLKKDA